MKRRWSQSAMFCLAIAAAAIHVERVSAQHDDYYYAAQRCLNNHAKADDRSNRVLECINPVANRTDADSNMLICSIRIFHQGYKVWNLPLFFTDSVDPPILTLLNAISDRDVDRDYALTYLRGDCKRSGNFQLGLLGDLYFLRATLLKLSAIDATSVRMNLPSRVGTFEAYEVEVALSRILDECAPLRSNLLCSIPNWTADHLGPGATLYERFVNSFRGRPPSDAQGRVNE